MSFIYNGICSIRFSGDKIKAHKYIHLGRKVMGQAIANNKYRKFFVWSRKFSDIEIRVQKTLNNDHIIYIYVPLVISGGWSLLFSPIFDNHGWNLSFQELQDATTSTRPFGERHKVAKVDGDELSLVGDTQYYNRVPPDMPGNNMWTNWVEGDDVNDVNALIFWGATGFGDTNYSIREVYEWWDYGDGRGPIYYDGVQVGDVINLHTDALSEFSKPLVVANEYSNNESDPARLDFIQLTDISDKVYVNGVEYILPSFHVGAGGKYIIGAGMIGTWIIYIDTDYIPYFDTGWGAGGHDVFDQYVNAYNTVGGEYRVLGHFKNYYHLPVHISNVGGLMSNVCKIIFSQDGTKFVTNRRNGDQANNEYAYEGTISVDENNNPLTLTGAAFISTQHYSIFNFGYKDNALNYDYEITQTNNRSLNVINWDYNIGFFYAEGLDSDDPELLPNVTINRIYVGIDGKIYEYAVDTANDGSVDYSSPIQTYSTMQELINSVSGIASLYDQTQHVGIPGGAFLTNPKDINRIDLSIALHPRGALPDYRFSTFINSVRAAFEMGSVTLPTNLYEGDGLSIGPMVALPKAF